MAYVQMIEEWKSNSTLFTHLFVEKTPRTIQEHARPQRIHSTPFAYPSAEPNASTFPHPSSSAQHLHYSSLPLRFTSSQQTSLRSAFFSSLFASLFASLFRLFRLPFLKQCCPLPHITNHRPTLTRTHSKTVTRIDPLSRNKNFSAPCRVPWPRLFRLCRLCQPFQSLCVRVRKTPKTPKTRKTHKTRRKW